MNTQTLTPNMKALLAKLAAGPLLAWDVPVPSSRALIARGLVAAERNPAPASTMSGDRTMYALTDAGRAALEG